MHNSISKCSTENTTMGNPDGVFQKLRDQQGAVLILVAAAFILLLAFTAFAIDVGHLFVVRNELQNAADAGALAGARVLYDDYGTSVNIFANQAGYNAATANNSDKISVDVHWTSGNLGDVQRGHWSFTTRTFTPNSSLLPVDLWDVTTEELDADPDFINAVRVTARREDTPAFSFFAGIFGFNSFNLAATAVAYIGYSGTLGPAEVDQPIAICKQSLLLDGEYQCNTGRMLNSGSNDTTHNTAGWTNFSQPCQTANANEMRSLICSGGNPRSISLGYGMGATGGVQDVTLADMRDCFGPTTRTEPWNMTLPVIDCDGNNVSNCSTVVGAVNINIVWISDKDNMEQDDFPPAQMADWVAPTPAGADYTDAEREAAWDDYVTHFNLKNVDDITATYAKKSIYFLPDCTPHELAGKSGGENFGMLAKYPVLVD